MAVYISPVGGAGAQFFTNAGAVLTGGKLYTYAAGTTTPQTTYTTSVGNVAWTNPIVLNAAGRVPNSGEIWLSNGAAYKFVLTDSNDVLIATYDNISGINAVNATNIVYDPPFTGSVETNVGAKLAQTISVKDFGAVGNGTADDAAAIQAALDVVLADGGEIVFPDGDYAISQPLILKKLVPSNLINVVISGSGRILKRSGFLGNQLFRFEDDYFDEDTFVIKDITIDGVNNTVNGFDWFKSSVAYNADLTDINDVWYLKSARFNNVNIVNCYYGARVSGNFNQFSNCTFRANTCGVLLNGASNAHVFSGCTFRRGVVGVHVKTFSASYGTVGNSFVGCTIESNSACGVILENSPSNTNFYGCYFEGNGTGTLNPSGYIVTPIPTATHVYSFGSAFGSNSTVLDNCFYETSGGVISTYGKISNFTYRRTSGSITPSEIGNTVFDGTVPTLNVFPGASNGNVYYVNSEKNTQYGSTAFVFETYGLSDVSASNGAKNIKAANSASYGQIAKQYVESSYSAGSKTGLASITLNSNLISIRIEINIDIYGTNAGGNYSHGASIRKTGWLWRNFNDGKYAFTEDAKSYANTAATTGATTLGALLDTTSVISVDTSAAATISFGITDMVNPTVSGLGTCAAATYSVNVLWNSVTTPVTTLFTAIQ